MFFHSATLKVTPNIKQKKGLPAITEVHKMQVGGIPSDFPQQLQMLHSSTTVQLNHQSSKTSLQ